MRHTGSSGSSSAVWKRRYECYEPSYEAETRSSKA